MKKMVTLLLVLALAVFFAVGCKGIAGKATEDREEEYITEQITLTFWTHQQPGWDEAYQKLVDDFTKQNPDIRIVIESYSWDTFESKIMTSLSAKSNVADIYELWGAWGYDFAPTGALAAMPDDIQSKLETEYYEPTYGAISHNGKIYGFPLEFNVEFIGMLVNKKILDKDKLETPKTWNDLIDTSKKAFEPGSVKGFNFAHWDSAPYMLIDMILSQGESYYDGEKFNFNTAAGRKTLDEMKKLVTTEPVTTLGHLKGGEEYDGVYSDLYAGNALFVPVGPWAIAATGEFDVEYGVDFEYVATPWYSNEKAWAAETGWFLAVNSSSDKQEAAFKFLNYITSDEVIFEHNVACVQVPAKKTVAKDPALIEELPFLEPLVENLDNAEFIGYFNPEVLKGHIIDVFLAYVNGDYASADEALSELDKILNEKM